MTDTTVRLRRQVLLDIAARVRFAARVGCVKGTFPLEQPRQTHPADQLFRLADEITALARLP